LQKKKQPFLLNFGAPNPNLNFFRFFPAPASGPKSGGWGRGGKKIAELFFLQRHIKPCFGEKLLK
jgi:hypothetical protein